MFVSAGANSGVYIGELLLPAGMKIYVTDIVASTSAAVTSDPAIKVGTSDSGAALVAETALPSNTATALTIVTGANLQGSDSAVTRIRVTITNDSGDAFVDGNVTITYFVAQPPLSVVVRGITHF
jgi:hypothetical protein